MIAVMCLPREADSSAVQAPMDQPNLLVACLFDVLDHGFQVILGVAVCLEDAVAFHVPAKIEGVNVILGRQDAHGLDHGQRVLAPARAVANDDRLIVLLIVVPIIVCEADRLQRNTIVGLERKAIMRAIVVHQGAVSPVDPPVLGVRFGGKLDNEQYEMIHGENQEQHERRNRSHAGYFCEDFQAEGGRKHGENEQQTFLEVISGAQKAGAHLYQPEGDKQRRKHQDKDNRIGHKSHNNLLAQLPLRFVKAPLIEYG